MDKRQKEVQAELLNYEEKITNRLKSNYRTALRDVKAKISKLEKDPDFPEKNIRHDRYQRMLEAQLETILHKLGDQSAQDMTDYLESVYTEAYLGCLYGMHGDGVDLILKIDEGKIEKCLNKDTKDLKFSARIYQNVDQLKDVVKEEISRGFSSGQDYATITRQIALRAGTSYARMCTIARTEGHRVTSESEMDCMNEAKSKGADVVKEWISTLDGVTRETHVELDGQIRELDEYFEIPSTGAKAMYPGGFGIASEDINCRCCMNQRARWNLQSEEYRYSRAAGKVVSIKSDVYKKWKETYNKIVDFAFDKDDGISTEKSADTLRRVLQAIDRLPAQSKLKMLDVKYEYGGNSCYCNIAKRTIRYADNVTEQEIFHEMGHLLECDMFPADEVMALKQKYFQDVSIEDVSTRVFWHSDGVTKKEVILVASDWLLEPYQGRVYVEYEDEAIDDNGNLRMDEMQEFLSVPISYYFTESEKLLKKDPEMYEFIKRYLK